MHGISADTFADSVSLNWLWVTIILHLVLLATRMLSTL